jgi:hypothetical protein
MVHIITVMYPRYPNKYPNIDMQQSDRHRRGNDQYGQGRTDWVSNTSSGQQRGGNFKIYREEVKRELIKYVYSTIDLSKFNYEILKYENQLSKFITGRYFVVPNLVGHNCFLIFTKLKSRYYSFLMNRRHLSYSFDKVNPENVYIHHCNANVDITAYSGTILDGIYVKHPDGRNEFVVTDVYVFKGADYTNNKMDHKLFELEMYLSNANESAHLMGRDRINAKTNIDIVACKPRDLKDLKVFMDTEYKDYEKNYQVRGVSFYPEISGTKLIYLSENGEYNENNDNRQQMNMQNTRQSRKIAKSDSDNGEADDDSDSITGVNVNTNNGINRRTNTNNDDSSRKTLKKSKDLTKIIFVAKTNNPIYAVLEMKPTSIADNYKMFALEQVRDGSKVRFKKYQMDIAYIPNMKKSIWCKEITTKSATGSVFVKCIWRDEKQKWEPFELKEDVKLPSLMEDIRKDIVEKEQSESDTDSE